MKEFFVLYWREILCVLAIIVNIVLWFIRKKPVKVVDTLKEVICRVLPALINLAEVQNGLKGDGKVQFVLDQLAKTLREFGYGDEVITQYLPFAVEQLEIILSTPQKKGR